MLIVCVCVCWLSIECIALHLQPEHGGFMPRLVAVSKKQPVEKVVWAYRQGIRHFGENYVSHTTKHGHVY